jgi:hypothetical protein
MSFLLNRRTRLLFPEMTIRREIKGTWVSSLDGGGGGVLALLKIESARNFCARFYRIENQEKEKLRGDSCSRTRTANGSINSVWIQWKEGTGKWSVDNSAIIENA